MFTQILVFHADISLTLSGKALALSITNGTRRTVPITGMALSSVKAQGMSFPLTLVHENQGSAWFVFNSLILKPRCSNEACCSDRSCSTSGTGWGKSRPCSLFRVSQSINLLPEEPAQPAYQELPSQPTETQPLPLPIGLRTLSGSYRKEIWNFYRRASL